jgi:hypothetical protein
MNENDKINKWAEKVFSNPWIKIGGNWDDLFKISDGKYVAEVKGWIFEKDHHSNSWWKSLCRRNLNDVSIQLMQKHQEFINWNILSQNPDIFQNVRRNIVTPAVKSAAQIQAEGRYARYRSILQLPAIT